MLIATKVSSFTDTKHVTFNQATELEIVCVECATSQDVRILVVCCYRPPNSSPKWLFSFKDFLDCAASSYEKIIITGDFDFPKISWSESAVIPAGESENLFYNTLSDHYLSQLMVYIPTREKNVLDLVITSIPDNINQIEVIDSNTFKLFSDYKCVLFDFSEKVTASHKITRTIFDYKCADFERMNRTMEAIDFDWMNPDATRFHGKTVFLP